jgi:transposase InsO family protein
MVRLNNETSQHAAQQFENSLLARHPKPSRCVHDQGPEFVGHCFQTALDEHDIIHRPTAVKNPQANAICERLHQTAANALRVSIHAHPPQNVDDAAFLIDTALSTAAHSARAATRSTLKISPGALIFHREWDFFVPVFFTRGCFAPNLFAFVNKFVRMRTFLAFFNTSPAR